MHTPIAVYPGTFDPITNGHVDLIERASEIFPEVIVAIAHVTGPNKNPLFSVTERVELAKQVLTHLPRVKILEFNNLLVDFMDELNAKILIRGLRAVSDFEYEFQMAAMNRHLKPGIETLFLMPGEQFSFVSSTMVKSAAALKGDIHALVHPIVNQALTNKLTKK